MTGVVITHDMKTVFNIADRVVFLREGFIHFEGTPGELKKSKDRHVTDFINGRSGVTSE
jgi:phospholipid/cholesterol/gamma-HCH transport system ATP-binding protein